MERKKVRSLRIIAIGYDLETSVLEVQFFNQGIYQFYGVPEDLYQKLMRARSKGQFVDTSIKNQYVCSRTE